MELWFRYKVILPDTWCAIGYINTQRSYPPLDGNGEYIRGAKTTRNQLKQQRKDEENYCAYSESIAQKFNRIGNSSTVTR